MVYNLATATNNEI